MVFKGEDKKLENGFVQLDFSSFNIPGYYTLKTDNLETKPFAKDSWLQCQWKSRGFCRGPPIVLGIVPDFDGHNQVRFAVVQSLVILLSRMAPLYQCFKLNSQFMREILKILL